MRARDCAQEGRILSTLTGSGPVTTALIRIEFFFGGKRDRARVAQMGHPEEGIEGSETVTEARAEEPGGGGTAVEARRGKLGSNGTAVEASTWQGIGGRTQIARKERGRETVPRREGYFQH